MDLNPNCRIIGYTGTPFRSDTGRLDEGENKLFDDVAYEISMEFMIEEGFWAKPVCPAVAHKMDISGVGTRMGDYNEKQLQEAVNKDEVTDPIIEELVQKGSSRNKWLVFTAGIEHAEEVTKKLNDAGVSARCVHSKQDAKINDQNLADHKAGKYKALINVAKLTTGYNDPLIDLIVFMRPTRSPVLYIQMIGRGVRVVYADGYDLTIKEQRLEAISNSVKPDCMVLDFGNVVGTLGAIDQVSIRKVYTGESEETEVGEAITKICPSCGAECAASQRYCYECSYCFIQLESKASNNAVMSMDEEPEWFNVLHMDMARHEKVGGEPSMKVTYVTMTGAVREWVCFQHHNFEVGNKKRFAWDMAVKWHNKRLPDTPVPNEVDVAVDIPYPKPTRILLKKDGKYHKIVDYEFPEKGTQELIPEEKPYDPWEDDIPF